MRVAAISICEGIGQTTKTIVFLFVRLGWMETDGSTDVTNRNGQHDTRARLEFSVQLSGDVIGNLFSYGKPLETDSLISAISARFSPTK